MKTEKIPVASILVLSLAVFITGFLVGMLAVTAISVPTDLTSLGFLYFALGLAVGVAEASLLLLMSMRRKMNDLEQTLKKE